MDALDRVKLMLRGNGVTDSLRHTYRRLFSTDDGKIVLEDLCKRFYVFDTLTKGGEDRDTIVLNEGKRSAILFILALLSADLELYEHILRGNVEE